MSETDGDLPGILAGMILGLIIRGGLTLPAFMVPLGDSVGVASTPVLIALGMILGTVRLGAGEAAIGVVIGDIITIIIPDMWAGLIRAMRMVVLLIIQGGDLLPEEALHTIGDLPRVVPDVILAGVMAVPPHLEVPVLPVDLRLQVPLVEVVEVAHVGSRLFLRAQGTVPRFPPAVQEEPGFLVEAATLAQIVNIRLQHVLHPEVAVIIQEAVPLPLPISGVLPLHVVVRWDRLPVVPAVVVPVEVLVAAVAAVQEVVVDKIVDR